MNELCVIIGLIGMTGYMGYGILTMFNYKFNKDPLKDITFFEGLKNGILCIIVGALYFTIGVSLCFYIKSLL